MEKKLRLLLPPDYAKDYRNFRPLDERNMRLRVSRIRRWRHGKSVMPTHARGSDNPKAMMPSHSPGAYDRCHDTCSDTQPKDIPAINPSRLLFRPLNPQIASLDKISQLSEQESDAASSISKSGEFANLRHPEGRSPFPDSQRTGQASLPHLKPGKLLERMRSPSYISLINSIMRYSSTDSWRSSWSSLMSRVSLRRSRQSTHSAMLPTMDVPEGRLNGGDEIQKKAIPLSEGEQAIWDELVDNTKFASEAPTPFAFSYTSLTQRPCCQMELNGGPFSRLGAAAVCI